MKESSSSSFSIFSLRLFTQSYKNDIIKHDSRCDMKNKKSLIILSGSILIVFVFAIVRMTYSNTVLSDTRFPDQNFYKCLVEIIGESKINSDGTIPDNILTTLIMLNCPSKEISSVKGIELLTNLEYSDLEQNNITEIDLTNNIKLKYLSLSYNQLTNIDLSKNTKLENLYLQQNKLTTVNISNQPELLFLTIANNQLSSINLSNNLKLKILYLFDNQLTSINISNNSKLTDLTLSENQLTNIDLSNNLELQRLYLDDN